jgi:hypothetical protein
VSYGPKTERLFEHFRQRLDLYRRMTAALAAGDFVACEQAHAELIVNQEGEADLSGDAVQAEKCGEEVWPATEFRQLWDQVQAAERAWNAAWQDVAARQQKQQGG